MTVTVTPDTGYARSALTVTDATGASADLGGYPDADTLVDYAGAPMARAVANGIVSGTAAGTLNGTGTAARAQFAVILWRFFRTSAL